MGLVQRQAASQTLRTYVIRLQHIFHFTFGVSPMRRLLLALPFALLPLAVAHG
jgi:hypothetical protein